MVSAALFALVAASQAVAPVGGELCDTRHAPEVGVGILCERARIALEAKELSVARDLADVASNMAPSHPGVWIVRAEVEQLGRQIARARAHYEKAAELEPDNPAILIAMGDFEAEEGNVRGAALLYEKAAELDAGYPGLAERLEAISEAPAASEI